MLMFVTKKFHSHFYPSVIRRITARIFFNGIVHYFSKLWETVEEREAWCAVVHGVKKTWT